VVGPFARCQDIRVARVQGEAAAAVLQNEAAVFRDYARAETTIIGARESLVGCDMRRRGGGGTL